MKQYTTEKQLHLRLMRTLTNKYAETAEPRFRRAFKKACTDNQELNSQIEQIVKNLDSIFVGTVRAAQMPAQPKDKAKTDEQA